MYAVARARCISLFEIDEKRHRKYKRRQSPVIAYVLVYAPEYFGAGESFSNPTLLWLMTKFRPELATCVVCLSISMVRVGPKYIKEPGDSVAGNLPAPYSRYSPGERDRGVVLPEELYEPEE